MKLSSCKFCSLLFIPIGISDLLLRFLGSSALRLLLLIFLLPSCDSNSPEPDPIDLTAQNGLGIYVMNEGVFPAGNGSVSFLNTEGELLEDKLFQTSNNLPLGNVVQSMLKVGEELWIVVNNSQKIEVVKAETCESVQTIDLDVSPRYLAMLGASKAYLTSIFSDEILVLNTSEKTVDKRIAIPTKDAKQAWTEQIIVDKGFAYVSSMKDGEILVIDTQTDEVMDQIKVGIDPGSMVLDSAGHLWVLCSGGFCPNCSTASLFQIQLSDRTILQQFEFEEDDRPGELTLSASGNQLFYLKGGDIYKMDLEDKALPITPFISGTNRQLYRLSAHDEANRIFATDAIDFTQKGELLLYDTTSGELVWKQKVGLIPGETYLIRN